MHNLNGKICPLIGKVCVLKGCAFFNVRLDGCEISILNYNLYQLKQHIHEQLNHLNGVPETREVGNFSMTEQPRFAQPMK